MTLRVRVEKTLSVHDRVALETSKITTRVVIFSFFGGGRTAFSKTFIPRVLLDERESVSKAYVNDNGVNDHCYVRVDRMYTELSYLHNVAEYYRLSGVRTRYVVYEYVTSTDIVA